MSTILRPPIPSSRRVQQVLVELANLPAAAAGLAAATTVGCLGSFWSERFPLNSGVFIAWSLHPGPYRSGPMFRAFTGVLFTFILLLVAAGCWLLTAQAAHRGRLTLRVAAAGALALPVLALVAPAMISEDTASYWAYGRISAIYDGNPFVESPLSHSTDPSFIRVAEVWQDMPSTYGPGFIWVASGVALVSGTSFAMAIFLFKLVAVLATMAVSLLILAFTRNLSPQERALRLVLWGWNPLVVLYLAGGGHNDAMVAVGLAIAALGVMGERHSLAFGGILFAALMKPIAIIAAPIYAVWLWVRGERRDAAVIGGLATLGGLVLGYAPYWDGGKAIQPLRRIAWRIEDALPAGWLTQWTSHLIGNGGASFLARTSSMAALVIGGLWILRHLRQLGALEAIALGFAAVLLSSTYAQPWYLVWVLAPLCFAGRSALERWWRPVALVCAVWGVKAVTNQPRFRNSSSLKLASTIHWLEGGLTLLIVVVVVQALRQAEARRREVPEDDLPELEVLSEAS